MSKRLFFIICLIIGLFLISNRAKADQNEANLYMQEFKLVFGDKYCEKVLKKYVFADCYYIDFEKNITSGVVGQKCQKLLNERIKCVEKHRKEAK